jgi:fused signal recognition particle receptor
MRDQSQIDDMRAAIRGDLERARARREADPWREPVETPAAEPEPVAEPEPEPVMEAPPEPEPEPEPAVAEVPEAEPEPKRGFLARLFGS